MSFITNYFWPKVNVPVSGSVTPSPKVLSEQEKRVEALDIAFAKQEAQIREIQTKKSVVESSSTVPVVASCVGVAMVALCIAASREHNTSIKKHMDDTGSSHDDAILDYIAIHGDITDYVSPY